MRVLMRPHVTQFAERDESGIRRCVEAYFRELPRLGVELVAADGRHYDLVAVHAGMAEGADVAICHGLYWTDDYKASGWEWASNAKVIESLRRARLASVPSEWVAETLRRDLRVNPTVVGHGVEWEAWQEPAEYRGWILWNKNRTGDVCDPEPVRWLAREYPDQGFLTTFLPENPPGNVRACGLQPHREMRDLVKASAVYLATTKETFGIGTLEAMAAGVPVLGFAHGGNLDLVKHGVNGYLAKPGDRADLVEGLAYCLANRSTLGANGREMARAWTWEAAAGKMAALFERALEAKRQPATVSVVIPTYKYAEKVSRAVQSALAQDWPLLEAVVVVDDGSPDDGATARVVEGLAAQDRRVRYVRQENQGVAVARNRGVRETASKYVCCLDADDAIEPGFLRACVTSLEDDPTRGVAFTGLKWVKPDGSTGVSAWPNGWDFDAQLRRRNQVPTCCVFRREAFDRLGGFRQRYAPKGAGAEDAEFWTRMGAYGWRGHQATQEPLFVYSWLSGHVTGAKDYQEPDWLRWHPWAHDGNHPAASLATPKRQSHPVRQYDEPLVSVVIPVGGKHAEHLPDALDSLEAQTFRRWEAVVVNDTGEPMPAWLLRAYPYARWRRTAGGRGAGASRNAGAAQARGAFLLFLDADDYLHPDALTDMLTGWNASGAVVYSDYVGRAKVEDPTQLAADLRERLYQHEGGEAYIGYRAADFDPDRAQRQPEDPPYLWANVTALVPKAWHDGIGGFDPTLASWEDVDYHWRMARAGHCYLRLEKELLCYRFYTGTRREFGRQEWGALVEYLRAKYRETKPVPCNCGSQATLRPPPAADWSQPAGMAAAGTNGNGKETTAMADEQYVMAKYVHPNRGVHGVKGVATGTDYGYRAGGDTFLVHREDVKATPHLFQPLEAVPTVQAVKPPPPPAPAPTPQPVAVEAKPTALEPEPTVAEGDDIEWAKPPKKAAKRTRRKAAAKEAA